MPTDEPIHDSPTGWVADHIRAYVDSDGNPGGQWSRVPTLLITTRGRKSGKLHRTALIYGPYDESYVIVASKGGAPSHPAWYLNLVADPLVTLQVGPEVFDATARTVSGEERATLWPMMAELWPDYDKYRQMTDREIPVVVLDPVAD